MAVLTAEWSVAVKVEWLVDWMVERMVALRVAHWVVKMAVMRADKMVD